MKSQNNDALKTASNHIASFLFKRVDIAPLVVFRMFFGALLAAETFGAILTGWVRRTLVEPDFTFTIPGFEFVQPLPGDGMYYYFALMGICGLAVSVGFYYRAAMLTFSLLWATVYVMQISAYNNHYYLLVLVNFIMLMLPAHRYASLDVRRNPEWKTASMPNWIRWVMISLMFVVYVYATKAKFYPDWLDGTFTARLFTWQKDFPFLGNTWFQERWFHLFIAYAGLAFDGLVVLLLLWKPTRKWALLAALFFHLFNSVTLKIGIFPYFALSFALFFYPPEAIRRWFLKKKPALKENLSPDYRGKKLLYYFFIPFMLLQIVLPLRHHFIEGNVFFTEEGHRHSWRMMLRSKSGRATYIVEDSTTNFRKIYPIYNRITSRKQSRSVKTKPAAMLQMAHRIRDEYAAQGREVQVYLRSRVSLNGRKALPYTDATVDLANQEFKILEHNSWIRTYSEEEIFATGK